MKKINKQFEYLGHEHYVHSIILDSEEKYIISGSHDKSIKIWDFNDNKEVNTLIGHNDAVQCLAYSSELNYIVSSGYDKIINVWDLASGDLIKSLGQHDGIIWSLGFDSSGKILASAGNDNLIKLWNLETFEKENELVEHTENILTVTFHPSNPNMLLSGSYDETIIIWDLQSFKNKIARQQFTIREIRFTRDGKYFAFCGDSDLVTIYDSLTFEIINHFHADQGRVWSLDFSPDNEYIATAGADDYNIKIWNVHSGELIHNLFEHTYWVSTVRFNKKGNLLFSASGDNRIIKWIID